MEEFYDEEELEAKLKDINESPAEFLCSKPPVIKKVAAAIKEEKDTTESITQVEQEIRDHSMSPADLMVEVRALIRKQNAEFESMRNENIGLQERVATLEAVLKAVVSLPQISKSVTDVCAFAQDEVAHAALQGSLKPLTLIHHATQQRDLPVIDYLFGLSSYLTEHALVLLNPPEQSRTYEIPKLTKESSALGQGAWWSPFKAQPNGQKGWLQLDAGREISLMGWKVEASQMSPPHERSFVLNVSNDAKAWRPVGTELTWDHFNRTVVPKMKQHRDTNFCQVVNGAVHEAGNGEVIMHANQFYVAKDCIAHARYFRLIPSTSSWNSDGQSVRFGLLILDDGGDHLVGPRFVRDLSPLHIAAQNGETELIRKLLDHGRGDIELIAGCWRPNNTSSVAGGKTALQLAASSGSLEAVQMLIDRGAKTDEHTFEAPKGRTGDLIAGLLQTNGSKPVTRMG